MLNDVRSTFPKTNDFIDSTLKEESEKERMTADEVIFYKFESIFERIFFVFRFGTKVLIFLFIDMESFDR